MCGMKLGVVAVPDGAVTVSREARGRLCGVQCAQGGCDGRFAPPASPTVLPQRPSPFSPDQHSRTAGQTEHHPGSPAERHAGTESAESVRKIREEPLGPELTVRLG
ncbi:hypothetical protein MHYP_G00262800 [Metynnis hypsauchen]